MELTAKTMEVFEYLKENGRVSLDTLTAALGRPSNRSTNANALDLKRKGLAVRDEEVITVTDEEGKEKAKTVVYFTLTDEAKEMTMTIKEAKAKKAE